MFEGAWTSLHSCTLKREGMEISVIIPALNEATKIGAVLHPIMRSSGVEVIVVDGGSTDDTAKIAEVYGARVIRAAAGRANQMNAGAAVACGNILIFLHADTHLPHNYPRIVVETLHQSNVVLGAFRLRIDSERWSMRVIQTFANLRSRWLKRPYGDQAFFVRRHHFRTAMGFAHLPLMEDFEFVQRMARWGKIAIAREAVVTSARRWNRLGALRTTLLNQVIIAAFVLGVSPTLLAQWYRNGRVRRARPQKNTEDLSAVAATEPLLPPRRC